MTGHVMVEFPIHTPPFINTIHEVNGCKIRMGIEGKGMHGE